MFTLNTRHNTPTYTHSHTHTAPSAPPQNVQVTVTSVTTASVSWTPPPLEHQNGVIISYNVILVNLITEIIYIYSTPSTSYSLSGLEANTPYDVSVWASTRVGHGPGSEEVEFQTGTASEYIVLHTHAHNTV